MSVFKKVKKAVKKAVKGVENTVKDTAKDVEGFVKDPVGKVEGVAEDTYEGVGDFAKDTYESVEDFVKGILGVGGGEDDGPDQTSTDPSSLTGDDGTDAAELLGTSSQRRRSGSLFSRARRGARDSSVSVFRRALGSRG